MKKNLAGGPAGELRGAGGGPTGGLRGPAGGASGGAGGGIGGMSGVFAIGGAGCSRLGLKKALLLGLAEGTLLAIGFERRYSSAENAG